MWEVGNPQGPEGPRRKGHPTYQRMKEKRNTFSGPQTQQTEREVVTAQQEKGSRRNPKKVPKPKVGPKQHHATRLSGSQRMHATPIPMFPTSLKLVQMDAESLEPEKDSIGRLR